VSEPVFPPNNNRIPILQIGSELHGLLRDTKLKGSGIAAGWPVWDGVDKCWAIQFGISKEYGMIGQVVTLFRVWPDGRGELRCMDRLGDRVAFWEVPKNDSAAMLDRVWSGICRLLDAGGDKLIDHLAGHADREGLRNAIL
jgi:hypothetical protein